MPNVLIRPLDCGEVLEVTLLTLFGMLADENSHTDVLSRLLRERAIVVELKSGPAEIRRATAKPWVDHQTEPTLPLSDFTANTQLHFSVLARVHCRAGSPAEAAHTVHETITGVRGVPDGFQVEIDQDDVEAFFNSLSIGSFALVEKITIGGI